MAYLGRGEWAGRGVAHDDAVGWTGHGYLGRGRRTARTAPGAPPSINPPPYPAWGTGWMGAPSRARRAMPPPRARRDQRNAGSRIARRIVRVLRQPLTPGVHCMSCPACREFSHFSGTLCRATQTWRSLSCKLPSQQHGLSAQDFL